MDKTYRSPKDRGIGFDFAVAVGLTVLAWALVSAWPYLVRLNSDSVPAHAAAAMSELNANGFTYVLIAGVFLPLALRSRYPLVVLAVAAVASSVYGVTSSPPALTMLAPLVSLFIVGTLRDRRTLWTAFAAVTAFTLAMSASSFSSTTWIGDMIRITALFTVAASLGDATRTRRAYIAAIEQRAIDAERTREDEARRRVEEERLRIARELHDITGHSLSIIALQAGAAEKIVERDPAAAINALRTIRLTSKSSLDELRAMLGVLRGADEDAPLTPAGRLARLPELVRTVEGAGIAVTLVVSADLEDIPAYADVSAFRIVQEALTNVVRHAMATTAQVAVGCEGDELIIVVTDDGRGMAAEETPAGHGISGMGERAAALGGSFEAGPLPGGGFRVSAHLPLTKRA